MKLFKKYIFIREMIVKIFLEHDVIIFPSMGKETVEHFLKPPIEGVILQCYGAGKIQKYIKNINLCLPDWY